MAAIAMAAVIFGLARIAIVNSERRDAEKKRGDVLQQSVNALRQRSDEDRRFFETIRDLMVAQNADERQKLIDELRNFHFTPLAPTTTTTVKPKKSTTTTTTQPKTSPTTAPRPPPSPTTTTSPPPSQPSPPPPKSCVTTPVATICPPTPTATAKGKG